MLHRAGLLTAEEYADDLERTVRAYRSSPARNASNAEITAGFFRDPALERIAYNRGDLLALTIDHEIRRLSGGARCLDDFMSAFIERGSAGGRVSTDTTLVALAREVSPAFATRMRAIVIDGATIELGEALLAPCLAWTEGEGGELRVQVERTERCAALL